MKWNPAEDFKKVSPPLLDIEAPPCPGCEHWYPVAEFHTVPGLGLEFNGSTLQVLSRD